MSLTDFGHKSSSTGGRAVAEWDYTAAEDNELSFQEGEVLTDINKVDPDWWLVRNAAGKHGLVPSNYLQEFPDSPPPPPDPPTPPLPPRPPVFAAPPTGQPGPGEYQHQNIEHHYGGPHIRLCEILTDNPWPQSYRLGSIFRNSSLLRCRLITVPLRAPMPEYDALSYYWGNAKDQVVIECSDDVQCGSLKITRNLYNALTAIKSRRSERLRYVWADGICMNQTAKEKNQQVPLMFNIYGLAARVIVWLGDILSETEPAMHAIQKCANAVFTMPTASAITMMGPQWSMLGFQSIDQAKYQIRAFCKFLARPWFGRMWCIQEFAMARSLLFLCGHYEIQEAQIMNASAWIATSSVDSMVAPWASNSLFILQGLRSELRCQMKLPLLCLLATYRHRHATFPQDKLYAIYSLANDGLSGNGGLAIDPDYGRSIEAVFTDLALRFFQKKENLDIMTLAGRYMPFEPPPSVLGVEEYTRCEGLPSWVPDWCSPDSTVSVPQYELTRPTPDKDTIGKPSYVFPAEEPPTIFQASKNSTYVIAPPIKNCLAVQGILIGTIRRIGELHIGAKPVPAQTQWHLEDAKNAQMEELFGQAKRVCSWMDIAGAETDRAYITGESRLDVFWKTMRLGHFPHGYAKERQEFYQWFNFIRPLLGVQRMFGAHASGLRNRLVGMYDQYIIASGMNGVPATSFTARTGHATANRAMFNTDGGLVGMTVRGSVEGDRVVIFKGGCVPFVVRPARGGWTLIGACYVHGCMFGEMWDESKCEQILLA